MAFFAFRMLIFQIWFTLSLSASPSRVTDHLALLDFKNQITNADTVLNRNWTANTSFCDWIGVTCSPFRRRVASLSLPNMNFEGTISPSIGHLSSLTRLDLSNNSFHGSLPGSLTLLPHMITLDLSNNDLTGSIPPSLFNISSLLSLDLSNNSLSGSFLLNGDNTFLELETIDLSSNKLSGEFPSSICRFPKVHTLYLSYNNLTGHIPRDIGCLSRLERFYITHNNVSGAIPPSLGNISSLRLLGCVGNRIHGRIPRELGKLQNLKMLGFDFNNLTGEIPPEIFNISSLEDIALTDNSLSGRIPATVGLHLPNLQGIYLADNMLEGEIPPYITNASTLKQLELSYNLFAGTVPDNLGHLRELVFLNLGGNRLRNKPGNPELGFINTLVECGELQFLIVGNNPLGGTLPDSVQNLSSSIQMFNIENGQVYGRIPNGIGNMTSMTGLILDGNQLTGEIPPGIGYLKELQRLYLSGNMLQGHIPVELCNLVHLGDVYLSENKFSGSLPSCVGNLRRLQKLFLGHNSLTSTLPSSLWEIRDLLLLNVSNNMIQGQLPKEIEKLETVQGIDLSNNHLLSVIPSSLGKLENLKYLSLSNNSFQGPIPMSFGDLISLEFLDLSLNNLSGSIPMSLEKLLYLREINVSYNNLEGKVPTGGVFLNSSPQSFEGNRDLCGMPFLQVPLCVPNKGSKGSKSKNRIISIVIPVVASVALMVILLSLWILQTRKREKPEDPEQSGIRAHQVISYNDIMHATSGFSETNLLGIGSSGSVYRAILHDGKMVAVKVLNLDEEETLQKRFDAECEVLKQIRHRNLARVITTCSNNNLRAIILEYMPNGSLDDLLHKQDCSLDLITRVGIMLDVAMAIEYLHHEYHFPVVHCDLKPGNVLLDGDMVAHVSDFGISKILAENKWTTHTWTIGTLGYIAPEYGSEGMVSTAGDVYSYGIMLMETLTRRRPTDELFSNNLSLRQWVKAAYPNSLTEVLDANLYQDKVELNHGHNACVLSTIELSLDCTEEAPDKRINMKDAVNRLVKIKEMFSQ